MGILYQTFRIFSPQEQHNRLLRYYIKMVSLWEKFKFVVLLALLVAIIMDIVQTMLN